MGRGMFVPYENNMTKTHVSKEATTRWPTIHTMYHITNANFLSWHWSIMLEAYVRPYAYIHGRYHLQCAAQVMETEKLLHSY